jgi:hypothetical protein
MKNVHLIPTDKPTGIFSSNSGLQFSIRDKVRTVPFVGYHIYITSDEEINQQTEPCWCINTIKNTWDADLIYYQGSMPQYHYVGFKKIILTTDPDLIEDGVQAIDDEFLEWLVQNPNCEFVDISTYHIKGDISGNLYYKIIIPREEPKQLIGEKVMPLDNDNIEEEEETLEEAAEMYSNSHQDVSGELGKYLVKAVFQDGAKWQAERLDTYDEMRTIAYNAYCLGQLDNPTEGKFNKWIQKFKKK